MQQYFPAALAFLVAAAGWFYLFYSRAAVNLGGIENQALNRKRQVLRKIGGLAMLLLGAMLVAGFYSVDADHNPTSFVVIWLGVFVLLMFICILGLIDLRLTWQLRQRK